MCRRVAKPTGLPSHFVRNDGISECEQEGGKGTLAIQSYLRCEGVSLNVESFGDAIEH
jgi:hypothetical protein